ncbi:MAG: class I SAM-dependent methyltransferase [Candidatus Limnocylindrales bacterium]
MPDPSAERLAAIRDPAARDHALPRYEDLAYRDVFWRERAYEDLADRLALRALLPPSGGRLLEVGAGFGRLVPEYAGWREVTLADASEAHVAAARDAFAADPRVRVELADAYALPFGDGSFEALVCVRVLHHIERPADVFTEFARVLAPGGLLVLEFANKRNLKAIVRWWLHLQAWSPFATAPFEYVSLHLTRHPSDVRRQLRAAGFRVEARRTASLFRWSVLSRHVPVAWLGALERPLQGRLATVAPGPSVWLRARKPGLALSA